MALISNGCENAFLHGSLTEDVYIQPPLGLPTPPESVCHLRRAIYGLKQAPRAWFECFRQAIISFGFQQSTKAGFQDSLHDHPHISFQESFQDHSLFVRTSPQGRVLILLYVDDMIITGDDTTGIVDTQKYLYRQFQIKDLGRLRYFLGLEIAQADRGILISQQKYTSDIIASAALTDTRTTDTPLELHSKLLPTDGAPLADPTRYRQLVGQLVYLCLTRPDIAHAVSIVSQFVSAPHSAHYSALLRILRYLRGIITRSLFMSSTSPLELRAYSDAD